MNRGIMYVVAGELRYYQECARSIDSVRSHGYDGPILALVENLDLWSTLGQPSVKVHRLEGEGGFARSRRAKTSLASLTQFDETLFLDTDTEVLRPIDEIWSYLSKGDLALALDVHKTLGDVQRTFWDYKIHSPEEVLLTRRSCPRRTTHFNSGVILFRKTAAVEKFFNLWQNEWARFCQRDQLALLRALVSSKTLVTRLHGRFNSSSPVAKNGCPAVIHHYWNKKGKNPKPRTPWDWALSEFLRICHSQLRKRQRRKLAKAELAPVLKQTGYWREFF